MTDHDQDVPDQVWEQTGPVGGAIDGELPRVAVPTVAQGVAFVREAPSLRVTFGKLSLSAGTPQRIGREPRRRRLILSVAPHATTTAYVVIGDDASQVAGGYGLPVAQGVTLPPLHTGAELWFCAFGADLSVGFAGELDQG